LPDKHGSACSGQGPRDRDLRRNLYSRLDRTHASRSGQAGPDSFRPWRCRRTGQWS
jgi:hypothetical protein